MCEDNQITPPRMNCGLPFMVLGQLHGDWHECYLHENPILSATARKNMRINEEEALASFRAGMGLTSPYILRPLCMHEVGPGTIYYAYEKHTSSLLSWLIGREKELFSAANNYPTPLLVGIIRDILHGLSFLHDKNLNAGLEMNSVVICEQGEYVKAKLTNIKAGAKDETQELAVILQQVPKFVQPCEDWNIFLSSLQCGRLREKNQFVNFPVLLTAVDRCSYRVDACEMLHANNSLLLQAVCSGLEAHPNWTQVPSLCFQNVPPKLNSVYQKKQHFYARIDLKFAHRFLLFSKNVAAHGSLDCGLDFDELDSYLNKMWPGFLSELYVMLCNSGHELLPSK